MKILLYNDHLRIDLSILEKIGAAKGSFHIPYENIVSAFSEPPHRIRGLKIAGTNFPGLIELGTFLSGTQKQFCYIKRRRHEYLVLVLKSNFYSKIIIETEKSNDLAREITKNMEKNLD